MKKITTFAVLPLIALASCSKNTETTPVVIPEVTPVSNTETVTPVENKDMVQSGTLNEDITSSTTDTAWVVTKEFKLTYDLPDGKPLAFNGNLEIEAGKVKAVNFPEYDLTKDVTYEVKFAKKMQIDLVWKEIKWLQYDGMSGASLTTNAFNTYLNTINK